MKYRLTLLVLLCSSVIISSPASAHTDGMAGSKWFFGKNRIVAVMEMNPALVADMPGIKEGHYAIETCSDQELQTVVSKVIQPYLDRKLVLSVNGKAYSVKVARIDRKSDLGWDIWLSAEKVSFEKENNEVRIDYGLLFDETDGTHINLAYMYRYGATVGAVPETIDDSAFIDRSDFTPNSHVWNGAVRGAAATAPAPRESFLGSSGRFVLYGIKHILTGYDHIAFLLALIAIGLSVRQLLRIVTAFTVAHSITLLLATSQIVSLDSRFVEVVIALSICYVALENLLKQEVNYRWVVTFGFGLIHGFGFASGLKELIVGQSNLLATVLSFNLGVETGQLMIFFAVLPVLQLLNKRIPFRKITMVTSAAVFAMGLTWLVERVFNVTLLSL